MTIQGITAPKQTLRTITPHECAHERAREKRAPRRASVWRAYCSRPACCFSPDGQQTNRSSSLQRPSRRRVAAGSARHPRIARSGVSLSGGPSRSPPKPAPSSRPSHNPPSICSTTFGRGTTAAWRSDAYEVLRAADRGVRVRILLDDIYHSGRDSAPTKPSIRTPMWRCASLTPWATGARTKQIELRRGKIDRSITACTTRFFSWMA